MLLLVHYYCYGEKHKIRKLKTYSLKACLSEIKAEDLPQRKGNKSEEEITID